MNNEDKWKKKLTPEQYKVLREKGTEQAFTGKYWDHHENGDYVCAACGAKLFSSDTKFDSGTGWPSFTDPMVSENIEVKKDFSHGMIRTEVICKKCGGHLGHLFNDGPVEKGGKRYCINSCSLDFKKKLRGIICLKSFINLKHSHEVFKSKRDFPAFFSASSIVKAKVLFIIGRYS